MPESIPQPFADVAPGMFPVRPRATMHHQRCEGPSRSCTIFFPNPAGKTGRTVPAKLRVTVLIAGTLALFAAIVALQLRSHQTRPTLPTGKQRPVPAIAAPLPQSPVSGAQTSKGLAVMAAVVQRVLPDVPQSARMTIRGTVEVRIRVTVDPSGDVSNATFDSPGVSKYFANLALQAARDWRFKPAQVDGQTVTSVWILRFQFDKPQPRSLPSKHLPRRLSGIERGN